jgi:NADP-dependent 3-hydroxy acid dehydrogenase YdfG
VQADVRHAIHQAIDTFGQIDILVNNAGMGKFAPATQVELTDYDQMFDVNVKGSFICAQAVVPHLQTQQSGHIVCVCSDVSHRTFVGGSVYCATKYAQEALTNALRKELRPQGIKVSGVYPGQTDTEFGNTTQGAAHKAAWLRAGDVADAIIYIINTPPHLLIDELQLHPISQEF